MHKCMYDQSAGPPDTRRFRDNAKLCFFENTRGERSAAPQKRIDNARLGQLKDLPVTSAIKRDRNEKKAEVKSKLPVPKASGSYTYTLQDY